jgi:HAD superfamily hydrolase (TIGR01549 family)
MNKVKKEDIKVVLFDHDDTLVGTIGTKWNQHKFIAKKYYGKELTDEDIIEHWGKPLQELVCLLYGTENAEEALARSVAHHEEFPKMLFEASIPTLKHLKELGMLIGIITATSRYSFEHDLELHGFPKDILDYTQTADDTAYHKPDPMVFEPTLKWLERTGYAPRHVVYVGDGLHDMKAATGAGFAFLGVETGLVSAQEFKDAGGFSVKSIDRLKQYFG